MTDAAVGLADAIRALREELISAISEGEGGPVHFRLAPIELSLQVAVTKGAQGKIGWHVVGGRIIRGCFHSDVETAAGALAAC